MDEFVKQPLSEKLNRQNMVTRLRRVERLVGAKPSARVNALGEMAQSTGQLTIDELLVINQNDGLADITLNHFGLFFRNQEGVVSFFDSNGGDTVAIYIDSLNYMVLENSFGGTGISMFIDDALHNVRIIDFTYDGIDLVGSGATYKIGGVPLSYFLPLPAHGLNATIAAGTAMFTPPFSYGLNAGAVNYEITRAGTLKNFRFTNNSAQPGTGTLVSTVRLNGVDTSLTTTVAAGGGAAVNTDTVNSVAVVAGDLVSMRHVNNASSASAQIGPTSVEFQIATGV